MTDSEVTLKYVHVRSCNGFVNSFKTFADRDASSWNMDDPRLTSVKLQSWLKKQHCALLHMTLSADTPADAVSKAVRAGIEEASITHVLEIMIPYPQFHTMWKLGQLQPTYYLPEPSFRIRMESISFNDLAHNWMAVQ